MRHGSGEGKQRNEMCECGAGEREGKMEPMRVAAYIRRLNDEYKWVIPVRPAPHIFICDATSPMNTMHIYSLGTWCHR
jgi:hypothetical protein